MSGFLRNVRLSAGIFLILAIASSCNNRYDKFLGDNFASGKVPEAFLREAAPGAVALVGCCLYYEAGLQKGIAAGQKWVYTNSGKYAPQSCTFDHMVQSGMYGSNCALPASWAYMDMGIMEEGMRFWGASDGDFARLDKVRASIEKAATITKLDGSRKFGEMFAEGEVKPGDVFLCAGHTFIYLYDNLFFAAGHDSKWHADPTAPTEDRRQAVFDSWIVPMESCHDVDCCPTWQISFKDDYMPEFYRNSAGELVPNPASL